MFYTPAEWLIVRLANDLFEPSVPVDKDPGCLMIRIRWAPFHLHRLPPHGAIVLSFYALPGGVGHIMATCGQELLEPGHQILNGDVASNVVGNHL